MGKVKSAIITALLVAAIIVLTVFATVSFNLNNGVKRYNSFISGIPLGGDLTGQASTLLYPEGVISAADYDEVVNVKEEDGEKANEKAKEYQEKYTAGKAGSVYVEKDKLGDDFRASVLADAKIISERFAGKGYSGYSVTVEDDYAIKVSVPTNFTYAAYKEYNSSDRSNALSQISTTVQALILDGDLRLLDSSDADSAKPLTGSDYFSDYFKSASLYGVAGNYAVRLKLTDQGFEKLNKILTKDEDASGSAYFYIGENNLQLTLTLGSALEDKVMLFQASQSSAQDYAIVIDSVLKGHILTNNYIDNATNIISSTPAFGENAAIWLGVIILLVMLAAIILPIIKYKKLGVVNALMSLIYALTIIIASMLIEIQFTFAVALTAILGLALLTFTNIFVFEAIRKETTLGRTLPASVKLGYKKTLFGVLDLHAILVLAALVLALVGVGEIAACGLIFFIATLASYVLYWFTRFMWFVISSPVRDKFAFAGFAREEVDDD